MFSAQLGRVARAGTQAAPHSTCARAANPWASLSPAALARPRQQRRLSSSKASCPPNSRDPPNRARQATPAQTAADAARSAQRTGGASSPSASGRKSSKAKANKDRAARDEVFDRLPSVPSTHHLHPSDITLSSFFSMHRPLSLTATVPPQTDMATFSDIFTPRSKPSAPAAPADVIYTLSNSIDRLDPAAAEDVPWEIVQESPASSGVKHLDGVPRAKTLEELVAQFRPFQAPPPPVPAAAAAAAAAAPAPARRAHQKQTQKSFKTTIIVTEKTGADGTKTYTAATTPMEPVREPVQRTPFLDRMRRREYGRGADGPEEGDGMLAISVKRQRKLKMKKHKYKKLMKRTRNLRRRLDRS